jgi:hypothetical protein
MTPTDLDDDPPATVRQQKARTDRGGRLLSAPAAAAYTGWPYETLRLATQKGLIPVVRFPGSRRMWFDKKDLDRAIDAWKERLS